MKTKTSIILLLCMTSIYAQYPVLTTTSLDNDPTLDANFRKNGNYAKDFANQRDQYVGLWRYDQNEIFFELKIEKRDMVINKFEYQGHIDHYAYMDQVIFKYRLIKNGNLIYDNLNTTLPDDYLSYGKKYGDLNILDGKFLDRTNNVWIDTSIKLLNTFPERIYFNLTGGNTHYFNPDSYYENLSEIITVPIDGIEMVRVN